MNVECNDPQKEIKNTFAAIRTIHQVSVDARIKCWWLNDLYLKHPGIQDQIVSDMFQRLGLGIQEAAQSRQSLVTLEKTKQEDDLVLSLSAIVLSQKELFNYLQILYDAGLTDGKHLNKEKS